jgi:O-antigen/teichoic acid export membrane protein
MAKVRDENFIELIKGSSISLVLKVIGMLFGYVIMLFITKYYGAEEWGIYSLCLTVLSVALLLPRFGFDSSLVRIIAELNVENKQRNIYGVLFKSIIISVVLSLGVIVIITLFSDLLVAKVIKQQEMVYYFKIINIAIIPMALLTIISAVFQALKKTTLFMLFQTTLINVVFFIFLLIYKSLEINLKTFNLYVISVVIVLLISFLFLYKMFKSLNKNYVKSEEITEYSYTKISKVSFPMMMSSSFALLMGWSDIFMLSYYKTATDIGIYNSTLKLAALSSITLMAVNAIATPKFVEFYTSKNILGLEEIVKKSTKMIFLTSLPILLVLIVFSKPILGFFGDEFRLGYLALIYLCISRFVNAISGSVGYIMQMTDQQKVFQNILIIAFVINLILNYLLIPKYSYDGAAIASSLSMIFWNIALVLIIKTKLGFWTFYNPFSK